MTPNSFGGNKLQFVLTVQPYEDADEPQVLVWPHSSVNNPRPVGTRKAAKMATLANLVEAACAAKMAVLSKVK